MTPVENEVVSSFCPGVFFRSFSHVSIVLGLVSVVSLGQKKRSSERLVSLDWYMDSIAVSKFHDQLHRIGRFLANLLKR